MSSSRTPRGRVCFDDSSDESMMNGSVSFALNAGDASMASAATQDIGELSQCLDHMSILESSVRDSSRSFEDSRPEEELVQGPPSEPEVSDSEQSVVDVEDEEDENAYVYDSFCVEDSEEESGDSSFPDSADSEDSNDDVFEEPITPSRRQPLRECRSPFFQSTPKPNAQKAPPKKVDLDMSETLYRELYPELFDENGKMILDISKEAVEEESEESSEEASPKDTAEADDSKDSLDRFLAKVREDRKAKEEALYDSDVVDDGNFVVNDSDLSEEDASESDDSELVFSDEEESDADNEWERERKKSLKEAKKKKKIDDDELFLISLSDSYDARYGSHPEAAPFFRKKLTKSSRERLCSKLYALFNKKCFDDQLPVDLKITWNARMLTTAGFAKCGKRGDTRYARIELAPKVCTTAERTRDTLLHEMCHVAVFLIDQRDKEKHGPVWKKWAVHCHNTYPELPFVNRCHNYTIEKKFTYTCSGCGQQIHRHSKSLDVTKKRCGICHRNFVLEQEPKQRARAPSKFALFVKEHYHAEKKRGWKHGAIMRLLSDRFKKMNAGEEAVSPDNKEEPASLRKAEPVIVEITLSD